MEEQGESHSYKVTLKSGDYSIFTNDNNFDDYTDRLMSGIYGITKASEA